jgi:GT2 family glycosyltransferase
MLSILIVNWNTKDLLRECLLSIKRFPPNQPHEVIVVDNASTDGSAGMVQAEFPDVYLLPLNLNSGYAAGNNAAFGAAQGEWLLTLNPDTEFYDGTAQAAIERLEANPSYGALGAKQVGLDNKTQRSVRGFPTFLGILGDLTGLAKVFPKSKLGSYRLPVFDYNLEQPAPQPMGTFLLFRREALASIGDPKKPFDESFPIFFNEVDLLYRLSKNQYPTLYSPDVRIRHHGGESTKQVRKSMIWESHRSLIRFFKKHYRTPWNAVGIWLLSVLITSAAFVRAKGYDAGFRA